jgi:hypothetical protein
MKVAKPSSFPNSSTHGAMPAAVEQAMARKAADGMREASAAWLEPARAAASAADHAAPAAI